ncbi:butyrophilin-like protein 10 [Siphateles boraxobius]|uniref:butyrophilin-like protein 10 n=1 Tax=Siphateles boraxobius TaxID=180520 RepID=UPI004063FF7E
MLLRLLAGSDGSSGRVSRSLLHPHHGRRQQAPAHGERERLLRSFSDGSHPSSTQEHSSELSVPPVLSSLQHHRLGNHQRPPLLRTARPSQQRGLSDSVSLIPPRFRHQCNGVRCYGKKVVGTRERLRQDSFFVRVPPGPVVVDRGATAFLSCEFEPDFNLSLLVINWQRQEDSQVVHSFYYLKDQLDRQSPDYIGRTNLNHNELAKGNASLSIANFGLKDAGKYLCTVSNSKGTGKGELQLVYAVFYSEPRLSIHLKSSDVTVQYEMEGYPRPEILWLGSGGQNLTDHQEVSSASDGGLYYLKSSYVTQKLAVNVTFTLKNPAAHQELQRHVILSYDDNMNSRACVVGLSILCTFLLCSTGLLLWLYCRDKQR